MLIILLVVLLLATVGGFPTWGYSRNWGYAPSSIFGVLLLVFLVLVLMGRIRL